MGTFGLRDHVVSVTVHACEGTSKLGPAVALTMHHPGHEGTRMWAKGPVGK